MTGRRRVPLGLLVLMAAAAGGAWWFLLPGPPAPEPLAPDLTRTDPEVAAAVRAATDEARAAPRSSAAWGKLGMLLLAHDFDTESRAAFRAAADLDRADYRWPYLEGLTRVLYEPDAGLERLRVAADLAPPARPEPRLRLAELLLDRGDLDGAAKLVAAAPGSTRAELAAARLAEARGDWAAAVDHANRAAADARGVRAAALVRGRAHAARGEADRADAELRAAAALPEPPAWPDPAVAEVEVYRVGTRARLARAEELIAEGRAAEAVGVLEDAAARAPENPAPSLALGRTLVLGGDPAGGRRVLEGHTARFPDSVDGWFYLGVARFQGGDFRGAADAFGRAVAVKPDHALAHFNLGHCHRRLGDPAAARAEFEAALRCRPDHQPSRDALAALAAGK